MLAAAAIGAGIASKLYETVTQKTGARAPTPQTGGKDSSSFEDAMQALTRKGPQPGTKTDATTDPAKAMAALRAALLRQQETVRG